jgi:hypothetical protein
VSFKPPHTDNRLMLLWVRFTQLLCGTTWGEGGVHDGRGGVGPMRIASLLSHWLTAMVIIVPAPPAGQ